MQEHYFRMYLGKFGQNSPTGSEDRVRERSYICMWTESAHFGWGGGYMKLGRGDKRHKENNRLQAREITQHEKS